MAHRNSEKHREEMERRRFRRMSRLGSLDLAKQLRRGAELRKIRSTATNYLGEVRR